jgi:hypothetical protein
MFRDNNDFRKMGLLISRCCRSSLDTHASRKKNNRDGSNRDGGNYGVGTNDTNDSAWNGDFHNTGGGGHHHHHHNQHHHHHNQHHHHHHDSNNYSYGGNSGWQGYG